MAPRRFEPLVTHRRSFREIASCVRRASAGWSVRVWWWPPSVPDPSCPKASASKSWRTSRSCSGRSSPTSTIRAGYVGESSGANLNRVQMLEQKPHWITCLEDTNDDGVFESRPASSMASRCHRGCSGIAAASTVPARRASGSSPIPMATAKPTSAKRSSLASASTAMPAIRTGRFSRRRVRLYIAQGRHGHEFKDKEGKVYSKGKAGRIYSCRLDGSDVRVHSGGGFDNPVEIEFTEEGEMIGTVNILYPNRGDCLMHWVEGGVYPREDQQDCISEFKWTGGLLGPIVDMGHVALSGLTRDRGTHFGPAYADNYFVTEFNTTQGQAGRTQAERLDLHRGTARVPERRPMVTSTRPTCWKTLTAHCSSSTPEPGSSTVAPPALRAANPT